MIVCKTSIQFYNIKIENLIQPSVACIEVWIWSNFNYKYISTISSGLYFSFQECNKLMIKELGKNFDLELMNNNLMDTQNLNYL